MSYQRVFCRIARAVLAVFVAMSWQSVGHGAMILIGSPSNDPDGLTVAYEPESGRVSVESAEGTQLTAFQLRSSGNRFTGVCQNQGGPFDLCFHDKVFKLVTAGFETVDLGPILPTNLSPQTLLADLTVDGATLGGGFQVGQAAFLVHPALSVPEPAAWTLCATAFLGCASLRRRRR